MVSTPRLYSLTGLRAIAAIAVFLFHFQLTGAFGGLRQVGLNGFVGVGFFFLLSGIVLAWAWNPDRSSARFYWLRFARVYPLYLLVLLVAWLSNYLQGEGANLGALIPSVFLVQAWFPDPSIYFGVQAVFWSLSVEAFFYVMFPIFFPLLLRTRNRRRNLYASLALAGIIAIALVGWSYHGIWVWLVYIAPPVRFLEFFLGAWIGLRLKERSFPRIPIAAATLLVVGAYALLGFVPVSTKPALAMLVPFALVLIAGVQADLDGLWSPFRWSALIALGLWSYGFYLIHTMVIGIGGRAGLGASSIDAIVMATGAFALAWIGYRFVEGPMRKRLAAYDIGSPTEDVPRSN